ncbi:N-formylglutamate amidohydrolase [Sneathiella limimaris]|uniref:N-formylglutamate amidohydrolase n=1 Tax=Sneathiella limimaris TaxID=1964213 RepID=UPI00146C93C0|nr:N-formylglutamate amidohydrolase [Sneathiella limimaris]
MVLVENQKLNAAEGYLPRLLNAGGDSSVLLICEHATNYIPDEFADLGLDENILFSHIAWDPGAIDLATQIALNLNAQLVVAGVSRLLFDCNRDANAIDAIPETSEKYSIPGNRNLSSSEKKDRFERIYLPFENLVEDVLNKHPNIKAIVTVHSFTPVYLGHKRDVEIGLLHDKKDDFAVAIREASQASSNLVIRLNEPYSSRDGVTHTLKTHGTKRGLESAMIEVKNDLLKTQEDVSSIAELLSSSIKMAMANIGVQEFREQ